MVKFILALSSKKYIYTDEHGKILTVEDLYHRMFDKNLEDHNLYLQLNWELADFIVMERGFLTNSALKQMLSLASNEIHNYLKSKGLKEGEKTHLKNTLSKIKNLNYGAGNLNSELILAEYLIFSLSYALIKPFWFAVSDTKEHSLQYNYSVLTEWLKNIKKLQIYLENYSEESTHIIFWKKMFLRLSHVFAKNNLLEIKIETDKTITKHFYKFKIQLRREYNPIDFGFFLFRPNYFNYNGCLYAQGLTLLTLNTINKKNESGFKFFKLDNNDIIEKLFSKKLFLDGIIFTNIKKVIVDYLFTKNIMVENLETLYFSYNFYIKNEIEINKMYCYLTFLKLENFLKFFKNGFYFSYYFDFRGRIYYRGYASPQATQIFRYCYHYGAYEYNKFPTQSNLIDIEPFINYIKSTTNIASKYEVFKNPNLDCALFWIFIEFGKLNKTKRLSENKWFLGWWDFIELGVEIFQGGLSGVNTLEKKIIFVNLLSILENFNWGNINKYVVYKDATASGIQLLAAMLGPKNQEVAKACNLDSVDFWYDTYSYIIHKFLKEVDVELKFRNFFKRNYLKKTIMTFMYSATYFSLENYFMESVAEQERATTQMSVEDKYLLKKIFNKFYNFLKNFFENKEFFENSLTDIMSLLKTNLHNFNEIKIIASDGGQINLEYNKQEEYRINIYLDGCRKTMKFLKTTTSIDFRQTQTALKPNATHSLEANLARLIIGNLQSGVIVVHDCFGASIFEVDELIITANKSINVIGFVSEYISWKPRKTYHSIFILC